MRDFIFKYRGWLFIPAALVMLYLAKPTLISLIIGLGISFLVGEGIRVWAVGFTGVTTRDDKVVAPMLITAGPYSHLRNPLYLGNLLSWLGFAVASAGATPIWATAVIFASVVISYAIIYGAIIPHEEAYLSKTFGEPFDEYVKKVPPADAQLPLLREPERDLRPLCYPQGGDAHHHNAAGSGRPDDSQVCRSVKIPWCVRSFLPGVSGLKRSLFWRFRPAISLVYSRCY